MTNAITISGSTVLMVLYITNIVLHSIGLYLLHCLRKSGDGDVQLVYIMNLSTVELVISVLNLILNMLYMFPYHDTAALIRMKQTNEYLTIVIHTMLSFVFYMCMILITLDKMLEVWLNIRYSIYCNAMKAKYLMYFTWVIGFIIFVIIITTYLLLEFPYHKFNVYCFLIFDFSFITIAVVSYSSIFYKYKETRMHPSGNRNNGQSRRSLLKIFLNSRFYISILLIASFILFMIVPDLIYVFVLIQNGLRKHAIGTAFQDHIHKNALEQVVSLLYTISFLCDGTIYILMQTNVRRLLWRKLRMMRFVRRVFPKTEAKLRTRREADISIIINSTTTSI